MLLRDKYKNIRLFGATVTHNQVTAKTAWINANVKNKVYVYPVGKPQEGYTLNISSFAGKPTPAIAQSIYIPIIG